MSTKPKLIEFIGVPGAGKTTLAKHLGAIIDSECEVVLYRRSEAYRLKMLLPQLGRLAILLDAAMGALFAPTLTLRTALYSHTLNRGIFDTAMLTAMHVLQAKHVNRIRSADRRRGQKVVVLDEGVMHHVSTMLLGRNEPSLDRLGSLVEHYARSGIDGVVYLETGKEIASSRLFNRVEGTSRFNAIGRQDERSLDSIIIINSKIVGMLEAMNVPVIRIQGGDSHVADASRIAKWIATEIV